MKIFTLIFFVLTFFAVGNAQQINQITTRCPSPNRAVYGSVLINGVGNIVHTPCPTKSSVFTGLVDFTGATVSGISGTVSGGTTNFIPRFASASSLSVTPFSYDGTTFIFNQTAGLATDAFRADIKASNASVGRIALGNLTTFTAYLLLDENLGRAKLGLHTGQVEIDGGTNGQINLGDTTGIGHSTILNISDSNKRFDFFDDNGDAILSLSGINTLAIQRTVTAGGTTGNQTINKANGSVNIAAGGSSIVITNSTVTTSSLINAIANTNDATCSVKNAVATANTITITMTANCTATTRVAFWAWN